MELSRASKPPESGPDVPADAGQLTLSDFLTPLWRSRLTIVAASLLVSLLAYGATRLVRPQYEALAVVRLTESKLGDEVEVARPENFRPLLENKAIAADLIDEFQLVAEPRFVFGSAGGGLIPPDGFIRDSLSVEQVSGTSLFRVRVRHVDPQKAAAVANRLVERAVEMNRHVNQAEVAAARDYIKSQLDEARSRLDGVKARLITAQQESQIDALRKDADAAVDLRATLVRLEADIEHERAFMIESQKSLDNSQELLETRRSIARDPALMEAARAQASGSSVLGLMITEEQVNDAHTKLEEQVAGSRAKLAGLEAQRRLLVDDNGLDREVARLLSKLYKSDVELVQLRAEYEIALQVYTNVSTQYADARMRVGGRRAQLHLVDPAVPPTQSIRPSSRTSASLGALIGLLLSTLVVLARYFWSAASRISSFP